MTIGGILLAQIGGNNFAGKERAGRLKTEKEHVGKSYVEGGSWEGYRWLSMG